MAVAADASAPLKGIAFMSAGGLVITVQDGIVKSLTTDLPAGEIICIRGLFMLLPLVWIVYRLGGIHVLRVHNWNGQI